MKKVFNSQNILFGLIAAALFIVFHTWILPGYISAGDFPFFYPRLIKEITSLYAWEVRPNGLGGSMLVTLWLESYLSITAWIGLLGWQLYERLVWFFPYIIFSITSSFLLFRYLFRNTIFASLASLIYAANTYALLMVGGGQMGIALSYAISPFGLLTLEYLMEKISLFRTVVFAVCFSAIFLLDIRIAYMLIFAFTVKGVFFFVQNTKLLLQPRIYAYLAVMGAVVLGLHAFWLIPTLFTHGNAAQNIGSAYTSVSSVEFFSFAKFENALGLLHPNWPENIFGKVGFMRPEFLVLPLLAYASLLFVDLKNRKEKTNILFFALLGLLGVFLAKGANDPFGGLYLWLFNRVPGFIMFRDPTKWYLLIAISYSILIPFTVGKIYDFLKRRFA